MKSIENTVISHLSWQAALSGMHGQDCFLIFNDDQSVILGWGIKNFLESRDSIVNLQMMDDFIQENQGEHIFTTLSYDLKNSLDSKLVSNHQDTIQFPKYIMCTMHNLIKWQGDSVEYIGHLNEDQLVELFSLTSQSTVQSKVELNSNTSKSDYIKNIQSIKNEIQQGNIYEMNYCIEFTAKSVELNSVEIFKKLYSKTEAPHSCFVSWKGKYVLCASPERYIQKKNRRLISQPIKGTAKRDSDITRDELIKNNLVSNPKERSENIMIVDLVRNDLSKIATKNSVQVDELCGVYSFKTVHQLISTVSCDLKSDVTFMQILEATFPMGSMTGAPKQSAMQIAERFENFKRGIYSGSIGVISPKGDFDFNVVIRSILYNSDIQIVSCAVGGAITIESEPEKEYEECLLKLKALQESL